MNRSEHVEQREFVSWFRKTYRPVRIFAIPNGGKRDIRTASKLKAEGVSAGVPDLYVPEWRLWVEMKPEKEGVLSKEQADWKKYLQSIGDNWMVCHGFENAKEQILTFSEYRI